MNDKVSKQVKSVKVLDVRRERLRNLAVRTGLRTGGNGNGGQSVAGDDTLSSDHPTR
jgi:hypothetical protein